MLRKLLDSLAPYFDKGGKFEKMYPLYEAVDTGLFSPSKVTHTSAHVRDGIDLKRIMVMVWAVRLPGHAVWYVECWLPGQYPDCRRPRCCAHRLA